MAEYVNPLSGLTGPRATISNLGRTDQGVDVTGRGPVYAMGAGTVESTYNSGWPGGGFILIKLDHPIAGHEYYYTAENIAPTVSKGQRVKAGQTIGHARGGYPYLELGWGTATPGITWQATHGGYTEGQVTAAGRSFRTVLTGLMSGRQPASSSAPVATGGSGAATGGGGTTATLTSARQPAAAAATGGTCLLTLVLLLLLVLSPVLLAALGPWWP